MAITTDIDAPAGLATHSLELVNRELAATLDNARREIEEFVDGQAGPPALQRAAKLLHLAGGALKIVEIHGAALLADEMEHTCLFLSDGPDPDEARKAVEALTRSMVQLPAYLERLLSGARDVALVLLPLLNDLRSVQGRPLMSEGTLLLLRTGPLERPRRKDGARTETPANEDFRRLARQQRPVFQSRLLGWIRGEDAEVNLDDLILATSTLEQAANTKHVQQFWGVLCGVLVALRVGGLEPSVALKRLVGQADRQLKRLADDGELAFRDSPPIDLLNNLLYYVARADCEDERVRSIRSEFNLDQLIPGDAQLERAREGLAGPSVKLMRTVAEAIKHDLGSVKDNLDIFVRTGMHDLRKLLPQLEMLQKIGDTLGVLGLPSAQEHIRIQMQDLNAMVDATSEVDQEILERIAAVLLRVEDDLDRELVRAVVPDDDAETPESDVEAQYARVTQAVMGECMVNLAKVKEAVVKLVAEPKDTRVLEQLRPQLRGIAAGLLMLNKTTVVRLIERIGTILFDGLYGSGGVPEPQRVERLADAIVSVEYYMETVSAGRKDPWYMLENAARCLELLERTAPPSLPEDTVETVIPPILDLREETTMPQPAAPSAPKRAEPAGVVGVMAALEADEDATDPELLEIFIEEARSEIDNVRRTLPAWLENTSDIDALTATRRSFHTLKGSGRTIGAIEIGEFAWSVENLLNRLINRTLEPSPVITETVRAAAEALPVLLDHLELGIPPQIDFLALQRRAEALAAGESATPDALATPEAAAAPTQPAGIDPVLAEIFVKEVRGHLATIATFTSKAASLAPPHAVPEVVYRACHTLLGSANMADYAPCIAIADPLSAYVGFCHQNRVGIGARGLAVLEAAVRSIAAVADALASNAPPPAPAAAVVDALVDLRREAERVPEEEEEDEIAVLELADGPLSDEEVAGLELADTDAPGATEIAGVEPEEAIQAPRETVLPHEAVETADFDPEIAAIFTEEAAEILDETDAVLQQIKAGGDQNEGFSELQRLLHTLKGGARMAGIVAMGDLSHSLETVLEGMAGGRLATTASAIDLVQKTLDQLQHMRDCVDQGQGFPYPAALLEELRQFAERRPDVAPPRVQPPGAPPPSAAARTDSGLSREEIIRQTLNQPLDFDLTEVGLELQVAEEEAESERTQIQLRPARLAQEPERLGPESERLGPESERLGPESERDARDILVRTGTIEFSDEQLAGLQQIAFEDAGAAPAPPAVPAPAPSAAAVVAQASEVGRDREEVTAPVAGEGARAERADTTRVDAQLLDALLNAAGEISIFQARLNQQLHSVDFHLGELGHTVTRLREQLRKLESETEAEILHRHQDDAARNLDFDPLELDRYSTIQQLSRALAETANDVASINELLLGLTNEADTLLTQQGRATAEIQDGLMQTRMVPFQRHVARFARVVRQAASDTGKSAELVVHGAQSELDRQVLDAMLPPFEHLLRNCVTHGIESAERRRQLNKPETGRVTLTLRREGAEVLIDVADDGAGLDIEAITRTAVDRGLLRAGQRIDEKQAAELILMPGFSTATRVTQSAGRGVGMDVVDNELKKLGGSMTIESRRGAGARFRIRLPYTLAITHALIVDVGDETFALPLTTVEGITRVRREHLLDLLTHDDPRLQYGDLTYRVQHLGSLVGAAPSALPQDDSAVALVLVRAGDNSTALLTDRLEGSREVVVKGLGPHISSVGGVTGATILGDGRVIMILDPGTLIRRRPAALTAAPRSAPAKTVTALVVDDSITMRRVTERLLERRGVKVLTARDGLDAISVLQGNEPDIILLDIEMPRMDGYQFAAHVRNDPKYAHLPIVMITSRSGAKHRAKAIELGVNDYLSKPYQEQNLIAAIEAQLGRSL